MRCFWAPPLVVVKSATVNGRSVSPFSVRPFGIRLAGEYQQQGNRSSPLYAICLNWIHEIQFVDFDSKLFYGRHCQIEPDGEHPTSIERNRVSPLYTTFALTACRFCILVSFVGTTRIHGYVMPCHFSSWLLLPSYRIYTDDYVMSHLMQEGYVGFSTEVRMSPKPLSHAQVGFEPTFCDKPQFLPLELFERYVRVLNQ